MCATTKLSKYSVFRRVFRRFYRFCRSRRFTLLWFLCWTPTRQCKLVQSIHMFRWNDLITSTTQKENRKRRGDTNNFGRRIPLLMAKEGYPADNGPASHDIRQGRERVLDNKRSYLRRVSTCEVYCDGTTERKSIDDLIISRNRLETQRSKKRTTGLETRCG